MAEKRLKNERIEELEKLLAEKEQQISELGASQPEPVPEPQKVELTEEEVAGEIFINFIINSELLQTTHL